MKYLLFASLLISTCFSGCALPGRPEGFIEHNGDTLLVTIDGQSTSWTDEETIVDVYGRGGERTYWSAQSNGKLCFKVDMLGEQLGALKQATITIKEIGLGKPASERRTFNTSPRLYDVDFKIGETFCPKDFYITPRVRFKKLPEDEYIVQINIAGTKNWDRQSIYLTVEH